MIDELAHTNAPGSEHAKRYEDVLSIVRAGISVITTLNVQHLEGLSDAVYRLTGTRVRETLPDGILELADDVIFIDATPQTLRDRLRAGKIYPKERIEAALTNFFTVDNLSALRELAIRETMHARAPVRLPVPFSHLMVGVKARARDTDVIARCARLAARLQLDLTVVHVARNEAAKADPELGPLADAARKARAGWRVDVDDHPERALVQIARESGNATLIVEGARHRARFLPKRTFGRSLLDAGAKELFLLAASDGEQDQAETLAFAAVVRRDHPSGRCRIRTGGGHCAMRQPLTVREDAAEERVETRFLKFLIAIAAFAVFAHVVSISLHSRPRNDRHL